MDPQLKHIIQWVQSGAPHAKDPRNMLFKSLFRSATIDPNSFKAVHTPDSERLELKFKMSYSAPDIAALKKKKLVMVRATKELKLSLEPKVDGRVFITHSREMFALTLEEVLALWNLYLIFSDASKAKLFQKLTQEEIQP
jgi:hypothetical protein